MGALSPCFPFPYYPFRLMGARAVCCPSRSMDARAACCLFRLIRLSQAACDRLTPLCRSCRNQPIQSQSLTDGYRYCLLFLYRSSRGALCPSSPLCQGVSFQLSRLSQGAPLCPWLPVAQQHPLSRPAQDAPSYRLHRLFRSSDGPLSPSKAPVAPVSHQFQPHRLHFAYALAWQR